MTCGIYKLVFKGTTKVYIGKSKNIEVRYKQHIDSFKRNKASIKLKEAYSLYGTPKLEIIAEVSEVQLNDLEESFIKEYNSFINGYNSTYASVGLGSRTGYWDNHSIYDKEQILVVFNFLLEENTLNYRHIAELCGVSKDIVASIACGASHKWLQIEFPEKYEILLSKIGTRKAYAKSAEAQSIDYPLVQDPLGNTYNVINTCEFAKIHGLDQPCLHKVLTNQRLSHKGWKLLNTKKDIAHMSWTDEQKSQAIAAYKAGNPTPENSTELIKNIADEMEQSANGVRMVLVQAGVYVKKEAASGTKGTTTSKDGTAKAPRVSKESQIEALKAVIESKGAEIDDDVLSKLTGKAAAYFIKVLEA